MSAIAGDHSLLSGAQSTGTAETDSIRLAGCFAKARWAPSTKAETGPREMEFHRQTNVKTYTNKDQFGKLGVRPLIST